MYLQSAGTIGVEDSLKDIGFLALPPVDYESVNYDMSIYQGNNVSFPQNDLHSFHSQSN